MTGRVLAVDDELHMLKLLERIISDKTPYQITTTHNALEVPGILERQEFDVIITDLKMPGLSGLDLLRLVNDSNREEEVIIVTAFGTLETAVEAINLGVFDFILKPFKGDLLIATLECAMKRYEAKEKVALVSKLYMCEPFDDALEKFKAGYLDQLAERTGGDPGEMVKRAGMSVEEIEMYLSGINGQVDHD
jgi:DNA-binding NtrC family response regulator